MRTLIQRVSRAHLSSIEVPNKVITSISKGMVILAGFEESDSPVFIDQMCQKIRNLRIFNDANGKMNLSGPEVKAEYLLVSQFTLYAECKYGNRPSFDKAAPKIKAKEYYEYFVSAFQKTMGGEAVKSGVFGSDLLVELVNDGPCTLWLNSQEII